MTEIINTFQIQDKNILKTSDSGCLNGNSFFNIIRIKGILILFLALIILVFCVNADSGMDLLTIGDYSGALAAFTQEVDDYEGSDQAPIFNNIGTCYVALGDLENASKYYEKAVISNPEYFRSWINLGAVQEKLGRIDDALTSYEKVTSKNREFFADALVRKGNILSSLGKLDEARTTFLEGENYATVQTAPDVYTGIGAVAFMQNDTIEAENAFLKAIELDTGGAIMAYTNLGVLYVTQGEYDKAKAAFQMAVSHDPDGISNAQTYLNNLERMSGTNQS
ncbi:tetratricopeptide repeat protein [Methanospirillum stamsii]|nr:tetratricopeptide repeat protein [Methanospirillum stamsii]